MPQSRINTRFIYPSSSLWGKSGCLLIPLSNVPQMPIFRAFSHFVISRKSTFSYYFLYRLVQNWYKIGTKIMPQNPTGSIQFLHSELIIFLCLSFLNVLYCNIQKFLHIMNKLSCIYYFCFKISPSKVHNMKKINCQILIFRNLQYPF